ncbi:MAG: hypothetical protein GF346_12535 [Candidatus Eisenbacteria bacterium]|nr:hypothetical protein [Candidatus Latescibacterota bacterium]MBD3303264.1 hypothetical protein [Candidatus Eisenbacteria bacterium]
MAAVRVAALLLLLAGTAGAQPRPPDDPVSLMGKRGQSRALPAAMDRGFDCLDLHLSLDLDFERETIYGRATHRFRATAPLDSLRLDLTDSLEVLRCWAGTAAAGYAHRDRILTVSLEPALEPGEEVAVTIEYAGHPPEEGLLGFSFERRDGIPAAYTLSEPYGSSSWWPCKDRPDDKMTATIELEVPASLYAGSNGVLVSDRIEDGRRTMTWRESFPIAPYLVSVAATNYAVGTDVYVGATGEPLPLLYLAYPEHFDLALGSWGRTGAMIGAFEERFGPYPFPGEKYGMAEFSWGGAMEHQTLTSYGEYAIDGTDHNDWLVAHELAHQWWGDLVTPASFDHIWLNEGFARFSEAIWFESQLGFEAGYRAWIHGMRRESFPGPIVPPEFLFNTTVYLKGAWVLHMLRGVLGDEGFFDGLNLYADRHAYGNADTEDLCAAFEEATGRPLGWFFDQWIYRPGRPAYAYEYEVTGPPEDLLLVLTISQVQDGLPYRMPLELEIRDALGTSLHVLEDSLREQTFEIPIRLPSIELELDPNDWVLHGGAGQVSVDPVGPETARALGQPHPSPGSPPFRIPTGPHLIGEEIEILDPTGRRVRTLHAPAGPVVVWDGRDEAGRPAASGVYLVRRAGDRSAGARKLWLVR